MDRARVLIHHKHGISYIKSTKISLDLENNGNLELETV